MHGAVDVGQHLQPCAAHFLVDAASMPRNPRPQNSTSATGLSAMTARPWRTPCRGSTLVVLQVGDDRHTEHSTLVRSGCSGSPVARRSSGRPGCATAVPLRRALVGARGHLLDRIGQRDGRCTSGSCCRARRGDRLLQGDVARARLDRRLDDHREHVGRQRVVAGDERVVDVVARIGAQLRAPGSRSPICSCFETKKPATPSNSATATADAASPCFQQSA